MDVPKEPGTTHGRQKLTVDRMFEYKSAAVCKYTGTS